MSEAEEHATNYLQIMMMCFKLKKKKYTRDLNFFCTAQREGCLEQKVNCQQMLFHLLRPLARQAAKDPVSSRGSVHS